MLKGCLILLVPLLALFAFVDTTEDQQKRQLGPVRVTRLHRVRILTP